MSARIDEAQVRHVAHLSRLKLTDLQVQRFSRELSAILDYTAQLSELDTSEVEPTAHALPVVNVLREDDPRPSMAPALALGSAPQREQSFFRVPKVLDRDSA